MRSIIFHSCTLSIYNDIKKLVQLRLIYVCSFILNRSDRWSKTLRLPGGWQMNHSVHAFRNSTIFTHLSKESKTYLYSFGYINTLWLINLCLKKDFWFLLSFVFAWFYICVFWVKNTVSYSMATQHSTDKTYHKSRVHFCTFFLFISAHYNIT